MAKGLPILLAAGAAFLLLGRGGGAPNPEQTAVLEVIGEHGFSKSSIELTDFAYWKAYPEGPKKLDPDDPTHQEYIEAWLRIWADVKQRKIDARPEPGVATTNTGPDGRLSAEVDAWIGSLDANQRSKLIALIGQSRFDQVKAAAASGDDVRTQAQIDRLQAFVDSLGFGDLLSKGRPFQSSLSAQQISKAKEILGV
jgi:hypothetical protein